MKNIHTESTKEFFKALLLLESEEDCRDFFEDICTVKELLDLAQRLDVAVLLDEGVNYQTISQQVNVSTATISRVSKCLNYGTGGYRMVLDRMKEEAK